LIGQRYIKVFKLSKINESLFYFYGVSFQVGLSAASPHGVVPPCCGLFAAIPNADFIHKRFCSIATKKSVIQFACKTDSYIGLNQRLL